MSDFSGDEGGTSGKSCCVKQGLEWAGEYWEISGSQTAVQQGRARIREENGGWGRKSLRWQAGSDLGSTGDRQGFLGGSDGKQSACDAGDPGLTPGKGRSPVEGHGNPLQYSCLENPMDRGA